MDTYPRPNVVISKCLGFAMCRYNGQTITDDLIEKLKPFVNFITVCPEMEVGLGVPRFPIRIVSTKKKEERLIQPKTGEDVTERMADFAAKFLSAQKDVDGLILKERSPSCGMKGVKVYFENGMTAHGKGVGLFARPALERFGTIAINDEGRLKNYKLRNHFLTSIFTLAKFREVKASSRIRVLTDFHADSKFLLMACSEKEMRILGKVAANLEKRPIGDVLDDYEKHLRLALKEPPKRSANINVAQHILGFFNKDASSDERAFFLETLQLYREERIPFVSVLNMLKLWAVRYKEDYLLKQTIFDPFPKELSELKDSGRYIEL